MVPLIGEIRLFGGLFPPRGWVFCEGQLLSISVNTALFSLIGTTYGGDGRKTFALPDLRGKTAIGAGQGPGLTKRRIGQRFLTDSIQLSFVNLPEHSHIPTINATAKIPVSSDTPDTASPEDAYLAVQSSNFYNTTSSGTSYGPSGAYFTGSFQVETNGSNQEMDKQQPFLTLNYIIALRGIYPPRS